MFATLGMVELSLILLGFMVVVLASGVWIAVALGLVGFVAMALTTSVPLGTVLATTDVERKLASWTLAALPLFIWMGEILFRTKLSEEMFRGLSPWVQWLPGRLTHVNVIGCGIFARGVRLVGRDLRDDRQDLAAGARQARLRQEPEPRLARRRRHARPADPAVDPDGGLCGARPTSRCCRCSSAASCPACS